MNYLIYIEHAAENLQFFLWHRDYQQRFLEAKTSDVNLAPEWTQAMETEVLQRMFKEKSQRMLKKPGQEIFKGTDFEKKGLSAAVADDHNPFSTPPRTPPDQESVYTGSNGASNADTYRSQASDAFTAVGAKQPCQSCICQSCLYHELTLLSHHSAFPRRDGPCYCHVHCGGSPTTAQPLSQGT